MIAGEFVAHLDGVRKSRDGWDARCPAHDDRRASLSVREGNDGRILLKCHAGCDRSAILAKLGRSDRDLFPARDGSRRIAVTYPYVDEAGRLLFEVVRFDPKDFRQRRPDGTGGWVWSLGEVRRVPYRLPEVVKAAKAGGVVFVVEGEKDADGLARLGLVGTTNAQGAGKWRSEFADSLRGCKGVVVLPDNDEPGRQHAETVARSLHAAGVPVKVIELPGLPPKGDVSDWLAAGGTKAGLYELLGAAHPWAPRTEPVTATVLAVANDGDSPEDEHPEAWPDKLDDAALIGPLGDFVRVVEPHTESDPVALLLQGLAAFGSVVGRTAFYPVEATRHYPNINVVLVGATSKGRKGTAWARIRETFGAIDSAWSESCVKGGLTSGEGLIYHVRDGAEGDPAPQDTTTQRRGTLDPGVSDKRLLVVEPEFASVLRVMERQGNTLSAVIRQAWDDGKLSTLTKNSPTKATDAHVSIIGHITTEELRRYLNRTEAGNGFGNRFLWVCVRRAQLLPFGGSLRQEDLEDVRRLLAEAVRRAQALDGARLDFDDDARELWAEKYEALSEDRPGMRGAATSRSEAQTVRLALLYALTEGSPTIRPRHLQAALEVWLYCEDSAALIFGGSLGDPVADELLRLLKAAGPGGLSRTEMREHFSGHRLSGDLDRALHFLAAGGLARKEQLPTGGRPEERWYAVPDARKARKAPPAPRDTALFALTAQPAGAPQ